MIGKVLFAEKGFFVIFKEKLLKIYGFALIFSRENLTIRL